MRIRLKHNASAADEIDRFALEIMGATYPPFSNVVKRARNAKPVWPVRSLEKRALEESFRPPCRAWDSIPGARSLPDCVKIEICTQATFAELQRSNLATIIQWAGGSASSVHSA